MNDFYRRIKLKAHFRDNAKAEKQTEVRNQPMKSGLQIKIITLSKLAQKPQKTESKMNLKLYADASTPTYLKKNKKHYKN